MLLRSILYHALITKDLNSIINHIKVIAGETNVAIVLKALSEIPNDDIKGGEKNDSSG